MEIITVILANAATINTTILLPANTAFLHRYSRFCSYYGFLGPNIDYWAKTNDNGQLDLWENTTAVSDPYVLSSSNYSSLTFNAKAAQTIRDHAVEFPVR